MLGVVAGAVIDFAGSLIPTYAAFFGIQNFVLKYRITSIEPAEAVSPWSDVSWPKWFASPNANDRRWLKRSDRIDDEVVTHRVIFSRSVHSSIVPESFQL